MMCFHQEASVSGQKKLHTYWSIKSHIIGFGNLSSSDFITIKCSYTGKGGERIAHVKMNLPLDVFWQGKDILLKRILF